MKMLIPAAGNINRIAALATAAVLAAVLVYRIVDFSRRPASVPVTAGAPPVAATTTGAQRRAPNAAALRSMHLFGRVTRPAAAGEAAKTLPETRMRLSLHGVFAGAPGFPSGAIIAAVGGEQHYYRVGDPVPGGATLQQVKDREVILRRKGADEVLHFPQVKGEAARD
jgi:general secretion pathway protein C